MLGIVTWSQKNWTMNAIFVVHEELIFQTVISRKTFKKVRNGLSVLFRILIKELNWLNGVCSGKFFLDVHALRLAQL